MAYVPLPQYQYPSNALLNFQPLSDGIDEFNTRQRAQLVGNKLASGDYQGAAAEAFNQGDLQTGTQAIQIQQNNENMAYQREQRLAKAFGAVSQAVAAEPDPVKQQQMWDKVHQTAPDLSTHLTKYGVDPMNVKASTGFLMNEAGINPYQRDATLADIAAKKASAAKDYALASAADQNWAMDPNAPSVMYNRKTGETRGTGETSFDALTNRTAAQKTGEHVAGRIDDLTKEAEDAKILQSKIDNIRNIATAPLVGPDGKSTVPFDPNSLFGAVQGSDEYMKYRAVAPWADSEALKRQQQLKSMFADLAATYAKSVFPGRITNADLTTAMQSKPNLEHYNTWDTAQGTLDLMHNVANASISKLDAYRRAGGGVRGLSAVENPQVNFYRQGDPGQNRQATPQATPIAPQQASAIQQRYQQSDPQTRAAIVQELVQRGLDPQAVLGSR